jgi:hypothetical protein
MVGALARDGAEARAKTGAGAGAAKKLSCFCNTDENYVLNIFSKNCETRGNLAKRNNIILVT